MSVEISAAAEAKDQIADAMSWWYENRPKAPMLFLEEYEEALEQLRQAPWSGHRDPQPGYPELRNWLLRKTRHHLLYLYFEADRHVHILALWNAVRGRAPKLPRPPKR